KTRALYHKRDHGPTMVRELFFAALLAEIPLFCDARPTAITDIQGGAVRSRSVLDDLARLLSTYAGHDQNARRTRRHAHRRSARRRRARHDRALRRPRRDH